MSAIDSATGPATAPLRREIDRPESPGDVEERASSRRADAFIPEALPGLRGEASRGVARARGERERAPTHAGRR